MRIAHIIIALEPGGAERMLQRLVLAQKRGGAIQPVVVSLTGLGPIGAELRAGGVEVHALGLSGLRNSAAALWRLKRLLERLHPDLVHCWMYHADLLGGIAARLAGIRAIVWSIRNTDLFYGQGLSRALKPVVALCARLSGVLPAAIVCVAESARASHARLGYASDRMIVIPNGYAAPPPADRAAARRLYDFPEDALVIGSVGRFNDYKDQHLFVRAAGRIAEVLPDARFLMVGQGNQASNALLTRWIAETGHQARFRLAGETADVPAALAAMDLFCLHSKSEGFPNALAEAMLAGIPAVATDVGDARRLGGETVDFVPPANQEALAAALVALARTPARDRAARASAARARVTALFGLAAIERLYADLYRRVLAGGNVSESLASDACDAIARP